MVGDQAISLQEYAIALRSEARRRFYHARPPEEVLAAFRREVADQLIDRALVVQEAKRRGIRVDRKALEAELQKVQARGKPQGGPDHDSRAFGDALRSELEQNQLVARLREQQRGKVSPKEAQLRQYYRDHPDKFTEPERARISVILLRVDPAAPQSAWQAAQREAEQLIGRLKHGADFGELARLHSADRSAAAGGDMGYLHKGMLSESVESALAGLSPGEVAAPQTVLEGVALFKLHERRQAQLSEYAQVHARVRDLWVKEEEARAWKSLIGRLRSATTIKVEEKYLRPS